MVSGMLNRHPAVLSLSEFFVPLGPAAFAWQQLDGRRFWRILSRQSVPLHAMLKDGHVVEEALYPHADPAARFSAHDLPPILATTLPHLTDAHEALFDELAAFVTPRPRAALADQYRALFEYLMQRFRRRVWIERSGASLMVAAKLMRLFPEARIVHVYRDGRETAMSMRHHHNFRVLLTVLLRCRQLGLDVRPRLRASTGRPIDVPLTAMLYRLFAGSARAEPRLADYGAFWSDLILLADELFRDLPPDRLLQLRFEDLQRAPREGLSALIRFVDPGLEDERWLAECAAMLRPTRSKAADLPADERAALAAACLPGLRTLGYAP